MLKKNQLNRFVLTQESDLSSAVPESSETEGSSTSLVFRRDQNKWIRPSSISEEFISSPNEQKTMEQLDTR